MIQSQGMALESGVPIGLGEVPGIPGLGGKAKVGKSQVLDHVGLLPEQAEVALPHEMRLEENRPQEHHANCGKEQEAVGFSQGLISILSGGST
jgi:hypothetical protein